MKSKERVPKKTAVVVGATGIIGQAIVAALADEGGWKVAALSRSGESVPGAQQVLSVDLLDPKQSRRQLASLSEVTHLFYAAYLPYPTYSEEIAPNCALLANAIEGLEAAGHPLQHVTLVTGAKYYGVHLGPIPTPAREDQPPTIGPIFNRVQEAYLLSRKKVRWRWTNLIAPHLSGFALRNPMNLALSIGTYASIVRELRLPLYFPGPREAFEAMTHIIDADQLGQAAVWAATDKNASGQVFNVANGDPTRWSLLWPEIADYFGVEAGEPRQFPLAESMLDQSELWRKLAEKQGLKHSNLPTLVNWKFLEFVLAIEFDMVLALGKIRRAGFTRQPDTMSEFKKRFDEYIRAGILPKKPKRVS